jgi:tRNA threonylcarbamoyladenosine modification (KEOPS) complex  Pcc1 subunit
MQTQCCSECDRLWKEYEGVVFEQMRAINMRSRIAFEYDNASYRRISIEVNRLTQARSEAQLRIRTHNRETHLQDVTCLV